MALASSRFLTSYRYNTTHTRQLTLFVAASAGGPIAIFDASDPLWWGSFLAHSGPESLWGGLAANRRPPLAWTRHALEAFTPAWFFFFSGRSLLGESELAVTLFLLLRNTKTYHARHAWGMPALQRC